MLKRWIFFFLVGLPVQALVYVVYPFVALYFWLFIRGKFPAKRIIDDALQVEDITWLSQRAIAQTRDEYFHKDWDDHTAMGHGMLWGLKEYRHLAHEGLKRLVSERNSILRRYPANTATPVSGDCLSLWVFAFVVSKTHDPALVQRVAWHYLKNCFGLQSPNGKVSNRCSNGGLNLVFDGWRYLSTPCFGPQYYTSHSLFSLCRSQSSGIAKLFWSAICLVNFLIFGGWLWWIAPVLHSKRNLLYYVHHITMVNLYSIRKTRAGRGLDWPLLWITKKITPAGNLNPFFVGLCADLGVISDEPTIAEATRMLESFEKAWPFVWQRAPLNKHYWEHDTSDPGLTTVPLTFTARLLTSGLDGYE